MANSLPVIATSVGGIPYYLSNMKNALLIEPKNSKAIESAIESLINDAELRMSMVKNGFELVQENTLEFQTAYMMRVIKKSLK
jgi:glycosyltransferase involved in cell wall biosynthesis